MTRLLEGGHQVMLETGGHRSIARVPPEVMRIVDIKCPASGEIDKNLWSNLDALTARDEIKFVIQDRTDYEYALDVIRRHRLAERAAAILFSPVHGVLEPQTLSEWMLADHAPARLQLQIHKYIWPPGTRGV
jgi:7-carboxy-7-deazaguanine synthase